MKQANWDDYRVLLAVARRRTLRAAGASLGLSPGTLSRRLDALEAAVGGRLVDRLPTGCLLTPVGERVAAWVERMEEASFEIARTRDLSPSLRVEGTVRINADEWVSFILAGRVPELRERFPRLELEILTSHRSHSLSRREADLLLRPLPQDGGDLVTRRVGRLSFGLYAATAYAERHRNAIEAADWGRLSFVGLDETRAHFPSEAWLRTLPGWPGAWLRCSYALGIYDGVLAGAGLGVLATYAADRAPGLVPIADAIPELTQDIWLTCHTALAASPRIRAVSESMDWIWDQSPAR